MASAVPRRYCPYDSTNLQYWKGGTAYQSPILEGRPWRPPRRERPNGAPREELIRDDENGLLADLYAPEQVATQVAALLDDPGRRARLGKAARQTVLDNHAVEQ